MQIKILSQVYNDLKERDRKGIETYGTSLTTFNGRNSLLDAYEEVLDLAMYIKQKLEEDKHITEKAVSIINQRLDKLSDSEMDRIIKMELIDLKERIYEV